MSNINEAKENLPIEFITQFVSKGWSEVGALKSDIQAIKATFKGTGKVEKVMQDLIDAYLIAIGQMEMYLDKKDYLDIPEEKQLTEKFELTEDAPLKQPESPKQPSVVLAQKDKEAKSSVSAATAIASAGRAKTPVAQPEPEVKKQPLDEDSGLKDESPDFEPADFFVDFDDPEPDAETDNAIREWLSRKMAN